MFSLNGRKYRLAKVGLVRAGCPRELLGSADNRAAGKAIVIQKNRGGYGRVDSSDYVPRAIVAAGARRRSELLDEGIVLSWAYVEDGAMEIRADHEIGCSQLMAKLNDLIRVRTVPGYSNGSYPGNADVPWIVEVYPFENYCIFQWKGDKYRQAFELDPVERVVGLAGSPVKVDEQWVNAQGVDPAMPAVQTGVRADPGTSRPVLTETHTGAPNSELVTNIFRNWGDITEAVNMYLAYIRSTNNRDQMRPAFYPVSLTNTGKIAAQLNARTEGGVFDFAVWSAGEQEEESKTKAVGTGERVPMSKFAYVGNPDDKSTWKLPIHDESHAQNALSRINQTQGIPASKKVAVLKKVRRAASHHGIGISAPTPKQKKWMHRGKRAAV